MRPDFTLVVVPDLQNVTDTYPATIPNVSDWIIANRSTYNIGAVLETGDFVNEVADSTEWDTADSFYDALDAANIPYLKSIGNWPHEYNTGGGETHANPVLFNTYFPTTRYTAKSWWNGGFYEAGQSQNAYLIVGKYLFLILEFGPRQAVVDWANTIVAANPTKRVVVASHAIEYLDSGRFCTPDDEISPDAYHGAHPETHCGNELWAEFGKLHANIRLMVSGHFVTGDLTSRHTETGDNGNSVESIIANWQDSGNVGNIRLYSFYENANLIHVRTCNARFTDTWITDAANDFYLAIS